MPITYEVIPRENYILETWSGPVSIDDVRSHWDTMLRDHECMGIGRTLSDLRNATLVFSDQDLLAAVHEVGLPLLQGRDWVTAIVVHRPAQLQLASRYQGIAASFSHDSIFSQVDEARRWLLKQVR